MSDSVAPFTPGEYERLREIRERVDAAKNRLQPWSHRKRAESILEQHALTDVPDLLDAVERLATENAELLRQRDALASVANTFGNLLERRTEEQER